MICPFIQDIRTDFQILIELLGLPTGVFDEADHLLESYLGSKEVNKRRVNFFKCEYSDECEICCSPELLPPDRGFLEAIVYTAAQISGYPRILNDIIETSMNEVHCIDNLDEKVQVMYHLIIEELGISTRYFKPEILVPRFISNLVNSNSSLNVEIAEQIEFNALQYLARYNAEPDLLESIAGLAVVAVYLTTIELKIPISISDIGGAVRMKEKDVPLQDADEIILKFIRSVLHEKGKEPVIDVNTEIDNLDIIQEMADGLLKLGAIDNALELYRQVINRIYPETDYLERFIEIGKSLIMNKQQVVGLEEEARTLLKWALFYSKSDDEKIWYSLGCLFVELGLMNDAEQSLAISLSVKESVDSWIKLGILFFDSGHQKNSLYSFKRALEIAGELPMENLEGTLEKYIRMKSRLEIRKDFRFSPTLDCLRKKSILSRYRNMSETTGKESG